MSESIIRLCSSQPTFHGSNFGAPFSSLELNVTTNVDDVTALVVVVVVVVVLNLNANTTTSSGFVLESVHFGGIGATALGVTAPVICFLQTTLLHG